MPWRTQPTNPAPLNLLRLPYYAWKAIKRIVRYLKGTPKHGLIWGRETQGVPYTACCTFADSSWADWKDDRTSRSGYVTYYSWGGPVGWKSRKERAQALSSSKAEYVVTFIQSDPSGSFSFDEK